MINGKPAVLEATPGKDGLMVRANDAPRALLEFKPVARDTFQIGGSLLHFSRQQRDGRERKGKRRHGQRHK